MKRNSKKKERKKEMKKRRKKKKKEILFGLKDLFLEQLQGLCEHQFLRLHPLRYI